MTNAIETIELLDSLNEEIIFSDYFNDDIIDSEKWNVTGSVSSSNGVIEIGPYSKIRSLYRFGYTTLIFNMKIDTTLDPATTRLQAAGFRDSTDQNNIIFHDYDDGFTSNLNTICIGTKVNGYWYPGYWHDVEDHREWQTYMIERYPDGVRFYQNDRLIYDRSNGYPTGLLAIEFASHGEYNFLIDDVILIAGSPNIPILDEP